MIEGLTFDKERHLFSCKGGRVPSVTQMIRDLNIDTYFKKSQSAMDRGSYVAGAIKLWNEDRLEEAGVEPEFLGYIEAYKQWRKDNDVIVTGSEMIVSNELLWYAGILDIEVLLRGVPTVIEVKTGGAYRSHILQLALYCLTYKKRMPGRLLYLLDTGSYKFPKVRVTSEDRKRAANLVDLYHWKHGGKKNGG